MNANKILRDFVSEEKRSFRFQLGKVVASSLTGFIVGAITATIILVTGYIVFSSDACPF